MMGRVNESLAIGTLASNTILTGVLFTNGTDRKYIISADLTWTWSEVTAGDGPLDVGLAHGDYSAAEILQWFASASFDQSNKIAAEQNRRLIRQAGTISADKEGVGSGAILAGQLADGSLKRIKLNMVLEGAQAVNVWVRNVDASAFQTGSLLRVTGKVWYRNA